MSRSFKSGQGRVSYAVLSQAQFWCSARRPRCERSCLVPSLPSPQMSILLRGADRSGQRHALTKQNWGSASVDPSVISLPKALTGVWQDCYKTPTLNVEMATNKVRKRDLTCVVNVPDKADVSLMVRNTATHLVLIPVIKSVNTLTRFIRFSGTLKQATDCSCSRNRKFEIVLRPSSLRTVAPRPHRLSLLILPVPVVWSQSPPEQRVPTWSGLV